MSRLYSTARYTYVAFRRGLLQRLPPETQAKAEAFAWRMHSRLLPHAKLPDWLISEMRTVGLEIEPPLYPSDRLRAELRPYAATRDDTAGHAYATLCRSINPPYSHVILAPWIKRGGADLGTLHHLRALDDDGARCLLITTEHAKSDWLDRVPPMVDIVELGWMLHALTFDEQVEMLARFLAQIAPDVIHNINSHMGWAAYKTFGRQLSSRSRLFASVYCDDHGRDGEAVGYAVSWLPETYQHLTHVFCDTAYFPADLQRRYGYRSNLCVTAYFPTDPPVRAPARVLAEPRILWAGRLCKQKRPDILAAVASAIPDVTFEVYGGAGIDADADSVAKLKRCRNVRMRGAFDGFDALPHQNCSALLYTTRYDGLPNILLEAAARRLPIIAPRIGGIPELVTPKTGILIDDASDVRACVSAVESVIADPSAAACRAAMAHDTATERHSRAAFARALRSVSGYMPNAETRRAAAE